MQKLAIFASFRKNFKVDNKTKPNTNERDIGFT
jgi:hypothetical protein